MAIPLYMDEEQTCSLVRRVLVGKACVFLIAALLLAGCGGGGRQSPALGYDDCVDIGGTIYTVDGPVGDDGGYDYCSDYRARRAARTTVAIRP